MKRRGFALLTVLWIIVTASAIALAGAAAGADAAAAHANRINATRARWLAHACADRARFTIDRLLSETVASARDSLWRALDTLAASSPVLAAGDCATRLVAAGSQLNVNTASRDDLERLFAALGLASPERLADATLDWIDADDLPRESGAEAAEYAALSRRGPRNGPVASADELHRVLGLESVVLDSVLGTDSARISLANAPLPVLAALPGFGTEVLARIAEWRETGRQVTNLLVLASSVSPAAEHAVIESFPEISRRTVTEPEAWYVRTSAEAGSPRVSANVELKLVHAATRAAVVRRREW